jgi:hypothetical protein
MPNWCDNTIEILARKESNDEIKQNVDAYLGRRFDDADVSEWTVPHEEGNEVWTWICVTVRTANSPPADFINHVLKEYKNVLLKGHYWIEGGCGAADFEMSSDDAGHVEYHSHEEIIQDYWTEEEELYNLQEETTLQEIEFNAFGACDPNKRTLDYLFDHLKENIATIEQEGKNHLELLHTTLNKQMGREIWLPMLCTEAMLCTDPSERKVINKYIVKRNAVRDQIRANKQLALDHFVRNALFYP